MDAIFDERLSYSSHSASLLQVLSLLIIGLMVVLLCLPPMATGGKVTDIAILIGGVAFGAATAAAAASASPVIVTVSAIVAIGAGATVVVSSVATLINDDESSS